MLREPDLDVAGLAARLVSRKRPEPDRLSETSREWLAEMAAPADSHRPERLVEIVHRSAASRAPRVTGCVRGQASNDLPFGMAVRHHASHDLPMGAGSMKENGDVFKALADETRRLIMDELQERDQQPLFELCMRLASRHGITASRQAISQHLQVLEDAGLIRTSRVGRTKVHEFDPEPLRAIQQRWPITPSRKEN